MFMGMDMGMFVAVGLFRTVIVLMGMLMLMFV